MTQHCRRVAGGVDGGGGRRGGNNGAICGVGV